MAAAKRRCTAAWARGAAATRVPPQGRSLSETRPGSSTSTPRWHVAPAVLLVDELAHSNAGGSRHPKRWQDIDELLDAGIDVWTTVNVQHIESLNDVVGWHHRRSGCARRCPITCSTRRTEVVLVDLPTEDLLRGCAKARCICLNRPSARCRISSAEAI
jgi:two-component system sensor histidine kinase KdpD